MDFKQICLGRIKELAYKKIINIFIKELVDTNDQSNNSEWKP